MDELIKNKINDFWSKKAIKTPNGQWVRWWQSPHIIRTINKKVSGVACNGFSQGLINLAKEHSKGRTYKRGISVGCGSGNKEMNLIQQGLLEEFTLYELAEERIKAGRKLAQQLGIEAKVNFIESDALKIETREASYDFVHWNKALHHMMDTEEAVKWSHHVLEEGGMFYMDDYVGLPGFSGQIQCLKL
ncbi:class I SAM-dependent methyltransferase [Rhodocytophaga rosea]|uniref:Class I SAM-dependent methyltransferase n=1 Tax=Rhodocytophaga rosea TaxID=2704465 RepID=A0A6C0GP18_9BACT|nr:class I SAM-dependent methyltransferase [Rhodocytophaga rosea]QHT69594.1 class I SAM-dependent methyltransferase [Rhodocytophaga rosea]